MRPVSRSATATLLNVLEQTSNRIAVTTEIILESAAQELARATSTPPFVYGELDYPDARKVLDDLQGAPVDKLPIDEEWITVRSPFGDARVRLIKPRHAAGTLRVVVYMHGGG
jgi:acetyl esterase/lipase